MKKNIKRMSVLLASLALLSMTMMTTSCSIVGEFAENVKNTVAPEEEQKGGYDGPVSGLIGTFTKNEAVGQQQGTLVLTKDTSKQDGNGVRYLYITRTPGASEQPLCYTVDRRLKLSRDYTYNYQYSIILSNPRDWGRQFAKLSVEMNGTYTYTQSEDDIESFSVELSNPTSGEESISSYRRWNDDAYNWYPHSGADYVLNIETALAADERFEYNEYIAGRTVTVVKGADDRTVQDDIFYSYILDTISAYCTY